jgi:hypothetical protein
MLPSTWKYFYQHWQLAITLAITLAIATTPFELLFGDQARLPSFPNEDIQQIHYGETSVAKRFNFLQKLRAKAHQFAMEQVQKSKFNFDKNTKPHNFKIGEKVLIANDFYNGKNPKLAPQFKGPGEIIDINDTNAKVKINNKIKVLNVNKLKLFLQESDNFISPEMLDLNFNDFSSDKPLTRACAKITNYKNAAQLALIMLYEESESNIEVEIDSLCDGPCGSCDSETEYFKLSPPKCNFTQKCQNC